MDAPTNGGNAARSDRSRECFVEPHRRKFVFQPQVHFGCCESSRQSKSDSSAAALAPSLGILEASSYETGRGVREKHLTFCDNLQPRRDRDVGIGSRSF